MRPALWGMGAEQVSQQTTNQSLDELAKGLASGTLSRGKALRMMGAALVGGALASIPGVAWADDCRRLGRECSRDSQCCSRNCIGQGDDKVCGCPGDQTLCKKPRGEGRCVNRQTNERHCGECFNRCPEGEQCVDGVCSGGEPICTPSCPTGCFCEDRADGTGTVCIDCGTISCFTVDSCEQCRPGTICVSTPEEQPPFTCGDPCQLV